MVFMMKKELAYPAEGCMLLKTWRPWASSDMGVDVSSLSTCPLEGALNAIAPLKR